MSNIAGKAYAINVITPLRWYLAWVNKIIFWVALKFPQYLKGLITLSLIHYARWVIIGRKQFPHLHPDQPKEDLKYGYMLFFSNFNGSWDQYIDSFTFSIPGGLDLFWKWSVRYPHSVALTPFHDYIRYNQVRVPLDAMLGAPGEGFKVAQSRLGGGRVHHAMRVVGKCQRAFDMMCERALSRRTQGKVLAEHQFVQGFIADSALQLQQFRLLVLQTAWIIDNQPHGAARTHIAMCKVALAQVLHDILQRAVQLHGSLGTTQETPLGPWWAYAPQLALADGPTEVHKAAIAKGMLRGYQPAPGLFPTEHIPTRRAAARERYAVILEEFGL